MYIAAQCERIAVRLSHTMHTVLRRDCLEGGHGFEGNPLGNIRSHVAVVPHAGSTSLRRFFPLSISIT